MPLPTPDLSHGLIRLFHRHRPSEDPIEVPNGSEEQAALMVRGYEQFRPAQSEVEIPAVSGASISISGPSGIAPKPSLPSLKGK